MFRFLAAAITSLAVAFEFLSDQFGLSGLTARTFWFFAAEAFLVAGLLKWALSAFGVVPVKRRAYWIAISVLVLAVLLTVNRIGNPPRALPHLQAQIDSVVFSDVAQEPAAGLLVVPAVSIGNAGESSIAEHFDLALHLPDGRVVHGEPRAIPERFAIPFPDGSALVVYGEDSLDRLRTRPIPRDGVTPGPARLPVPVADPRRGCRRRGVLSADDAGRLGPRLRHADDPGRRRRRCRLRRGRAEPPGPSVGGHAAGHGDASRVCPGAALAGPPGTGIPTSPRSRARRTRPSASRPPAGPVCLPWAAWRKSGFPRTGS